MKPAFALLGVLCVCIACDQTSPNLVVWSDLPAAPSMEQSTNTAASDVSGDIDRREAVSAETRDLAPQISGGSRQTPDATPTQDNDGLSGAEPNVLTVSETSKRLSRYYQRLQNDLITQGLLRTDDGLDDAPYTENDLARNFINIALYDEYVLVGEQFLAQSTNSHLRRWDGPVRMNIEFGSQIGTEQKQKDINVVKAFAAQLSELTGLPIPVTAQGGDDSADFQVLFLTEDDRLSYRERLKLLIPGIRPGALDALVNLPQDQLCVVAAFAEAGRAGYSKAVAIIRGEHPDLLRKVCVHEELAQGMGLANDSLQARPSIFNDDEEFAFLTGHDALLLRMLYDDRFKLGMTAQEATPIAREVARELILEQKEQAASVDVAQQ